MTSLDYDVARTTRIGRCDYVITLHPGGPGRTAMLSFREPRRRVAFLLPLENVLHAAVLRFVELERGEKRRARKVGLSWRHYRAAWVKRLLPPKSFLTFQSNCPYHGPMP